MTTARDALAAFGHHADSCEFALTVCTCGFTEAMRAVFGLVPVTSIAPRATIVIESHRVPDDGQDHEASTRCSCQPTVRVEHRPREGQ